MRDLVLDMIQETVIKMVLEDTFSIAPDLYCNPVKLDHILVDVLTILHGQVVKLVPHISDRVMCIKVCLEFQDELLVAFHPFCMELRIVHEEEVFGKVIRQS